MMKNNTVFKKIMFAMLLSGIFALTVTGCSDDKEKTVAPKSNHNPNPFDHSGEPKVTSNEKEKFEHDFAAQCIEREVKNSTNPAEDRERVSAPCHCIAKFMMKDLTPQEADKFLTEHENPQSLRIKYENAAYHCLQEKTSPHEPDFSKAEELK
jgi:hypothetical protein